MSFSRKLSYSAAAAALFALAAPAAVYAQVTSTEIRGSVTAQGGVAVDGATVTIIHIPTGTSTTTTTSAGGSFSARGLRAGGPFRVIATADGYQASVVEDAFTSIGAPLSLDLTLESGSADTIVVLGSRIVGADLAVGPSTVFDLNDLQNSPAINRDLKDIVRIDPRVYLDESFNDGIQCAGANPRYNSLTVDGIGLNDGFGLNSNGYPTERMPFPFDAISQVSVELAPFDVQYGGFTACNINAVTRSGTNEFHGSLFFDYTDDGLRGDSIEGAPVFVPEFDERRFGASFGGPIIEDRLFFFASYERFEGSNLFFRGPEGSGAATEVTGFTQADYDRIRTAALNIYGYDPGGIPADSAATDEKYLVRLDWNINDNHRAAFTYNYNTGLNLTESDGDSNEFEYSNHLYNRGAELQAYALQVNSNWTDNFSTELRLALNDVDFTQASSGGTDFGEVQIRVGGNTVYLGADDSRHSNDLDYSTLSLRLGGQYNWNDHLFSFGYDLQRFDIFNLFVQHSEGEWRFNSIADFEAGNVARVYYGNAAGTNNPNDAGATFQYDINTLYFQDEFQPHPDVTLTAGLRYEWYTNDDTPNLNANFVARNGFSNQENLDGVDLIQPRFGFTWDARDDLSIRGGFGLYSGGNPNVWVSNSYSNDGITNVQLQYRPPVIGNLFTEPMTQDEGGQGRPIWGIPQSMFDAVANGTANSTVNAIDPNFEAPSEWKFALGGTFDFELPQFQDMFSLNVDLLYSRTNNASYVYDATLAQIGTAPDGRPIYRRIDRSDPNCATSPATCTGRGFDNDLILSNTDGGHSFVFSASLAQEIEALGIDWTLGYAYTDAEDTNPMTSSVAYSNWVNIAVSDINNPSRSTSNYEIPHRFTMLVSWERDFFADLTTRATLFGQAFQGRPYTFSFDGGSGNMFGDGQVFAHLLYVPLQNDPNVIYGPNFDVAAFDAFIAQNGLTRGQIVGRNSQEGQWTNKFDLRLEQEFPGFNTEHSASAFLVLENLGNMINDDWGVFYQAPFPQRRAVVDADIDANGNYVYNSLNSGLNGESRVGDASFWTVRMGLRYEF